MKNSIFGRFNENKKWNDYFNLKTFECRISLLMVAVIVVTFVILRVYDNFNDFLTPLQNITIYIASALIGMLGIILAGIAIIIGVLNNNIVKSIEKLNDKGSIQKVLVSFEFLAFNIGIGILIFFLIHIILYSHKGIIPEFPFYFVLIIISYLFSFIIFYAVSLISNSVRVFFITGLYSDIINNEKTIYDLSNEIRIDFILRSILKDTSKEEFLAKLFEMIDSSDIKDKEAVKTYLKNYYP